MFSHSQREGAFRFGGDRNASFRSRRWKAACILNQKIADLLGLMFPLPLLGRADKVIE